MEFREPQIVLCCRCELPRTPSDRMLNLTVESVGSPCLNAWELWLVNKAKEERVKLEKKSLEASKSQFSMVSLQLFYYFDVLFFFVIPHQVFLSHVSFVLRFTSYFTNTVINLCPR